MSSSADADIGLITPDDRGRVVLIYHAPVAMALFGIICITSIAAACITCWSQIVFHDVPFLQHVQHGALLVYAISGAPGVPWVPVLILNFICPLTLVIDDKGIYRSNIGLTKVMKWSDINRITVEHVYDRYNQNRYKTTVIGPNSTLNWYSFLIYRLQHWADTLQSVSQRFAQPFLAHLLPRKLPMVLHLTSALDQIG
jgi:hypothetical protein